MLLCILSRKYTKTSESEKINFMWHALKVGPLQDLSRSLKRLCHWAAFQRKNPIKSEPSALWKKLHIAYIELYIGFYYVFSWRPFSETELEYLLSSFNRCFFRHSVSLQTGNCRSCSDLQGLTEVYKNGTIAANSINQSNFLVISERDHHYYSSNNVSLVLLFKGSYLLKRIFSCQFCLGGQILGFC